MKVFAALESLLYSKANMADTTRDQIAIDSENSAFEISDNTDHSDHSDHTSNTDTGEAEAEAEAEYEAEKPLQTQESSWFRPFRPLEEENIVISYFQDENVFRFRIEHNHAPRPLVGAVFRTPYGDEKVSLNELTLPLNRFLSMSECWNPPYAGHVVMICDQEKDDSVNYVIENTTGPQIREAFIFLHKRQANEDREDDATMCVVMATIVLLVGVLMALGVYLRFGAVSQTV